MSKTHTVFAYGTLKAGFHNHWHIQGAKFLGVGETVESYKMYDLGHYPGVKKEEGPTPITGEIYEINDEQLAACDRLEGHPNFYNREKVKVRLFHTEPERFSTLDASIYFIQHTNAFEARSKPMKRGHWDNKRKVA
jgi:gamma-glutamylcyclotransferase (GGCT)/AIG2-like uncharacterized protein YtfP